MAVAMAALWCIVMCDSEQMPPFPTMLIASGYYKSFLVKLYFFSNTKGVPTRLQTCFFDTSNAKEQNDHKWD